MVVVGVGGKCDHPVAVHRDSRLPDRRFPAIVRRECGRPRNRRALCDGLVSRLMYLPLLQIRTRARTKYTADE